jgi:large subunit ribosomal protein L22
LIFKEIQINEGPSFKRWRAGSRGRIKPYKRRTSHIRVVLEAKESNKKKEAKEKVVKDRQKTTKKGVKK